MKSKKSKACGLRENIARLEERIYASDRALELARSSLSRNSLVSFITILVSIIAIVTVWIKNN